MSIFDRDALEQSPLADLHTIASELSIDSFRRMRKAELIEAILARQEGRESDRPAEEEGSRPEHDAAPPEHDAAPPERDAIPPEHDAATSEQDAAPAERDAATARRGRWRRGGRGRQGSDDAGSSDEAPASSDSPEPPEQGHRETDQAVDSAEQEAVEGVVELLPGGSGFVRVHPPEPSDEDVYISSAQIKRCELVTGDRVSGPRRPPRRSERFASLLRVDTVNDRPATELADGPRFDELPIDFPDSRFVLPSEDELLAAIDRTAPIGHGSRVTIVGPAGSGKSETLRRLARALSDGGEERLWLVLTGVRPEEIPEWQAGPVAPAAALSFAASADAQTQALDAVVEQVRRLVVRGTHAVLLIDTLDAVSPGSVRKALASARNVTGGGSLTVIGTARAPVGGETTVVALSAPQAGAEVTPALDPAGSRTLRRERLAG